MTTIAILIILILVQLIAHFMRPVRVEWEMVVLPPPPRWEPEVTKVRYPVLVPPTVTLAKECFHHAEWDDQEQYEKLRPSDKTLRYHNPKSFERKEKELRDLRRSQRAVKALMRA